MLQAAHYEKAKNIEAGMVAIDQALTALTKEKVAKPLKYDVSGFPRCLLLRFNI